MIRNLQYPITKIHPDWHPVRVKTTSMQPEAIRELASKLEAHHSPHQFAVLGTGDTSAYIIYFEDAGDALWFRLKDCRI
jgi:hypothetical protein